MSLALRRGSVAVALAAALVVAAVAPAQAASAPARVTGAHVNSQSWANRTVALYWKAVPGATYSTKWSTSTSFSSAKSKKSTAAKVSVGPLSPGKTYYAVVRAIKAGKSGAYSARVTLTLKPGYTGLFSSVSAKAATGGITIKWGAAPYATDYRVTSSAGPDRSRRPDYWVPSTTAWFSAFNPVTKARKITGKASQLTSTPYGNPIYAQVQARSTIKPSAHLRDSAQVVAWPAPTKPDASGLGVKFASYNVECSGCEKSGTAKWPTRGRVIAQNISAQAPDVLAAVEASGDSDGNPANPQRQVYLDLDSRLSALKLTDSDPAPSTSNQGNRLYYNPSKFTLVSKGWLSGIRDYSKADTHSTNTPWAKLQSKSDPKTQFFVVAAHFSIPTTSSKNERKTLLGKNSAQLLKALNAKNTTHLPVILGGDFNDNRYPEGRIDGAQPTLIRGGFYDSSASLHRYGTYKSTYNNSQSPSKQISDRNGDGQRIDYILTQGMRGSQSFTNVWNPKTAAGKSLSLVPSDHNLITAVLRVPRK